MAVSSAYQRSILFFGVVLVYYSALFTPLCLLDDSRLIFFDVADAKPGQILALLFSGGGYYRPLIGITFVLDNYFWLLQESFLHLENVLLHGSNTLLLFAVTERLVKRSAVPDSTGIPFVVALLFALHPLATESVNWISGRTDPLASLFLLLSLKILLDWLESPTRLRLFLMQWWYFLACLSKETAVFYIGPALVMLTVLRIKQLQAVDGVTVVPFLSRCWVAVRRDWQVTACFFLTTAGYFTLRRYAAMTSEGRDRGLSKLALNTTQQSLDSLWFDKLMEVFRTIGFYTKKLFVPWPLNFNIVQVSDWYVLLGLMVVVLLGLWGWQRRDLVVALVLSAFLLASSALLVSVGKLAWTPYAERYLYIPLIFFLPASILWLYEKTAAIREGQLFRIIVLALCSLSLITTVQRNLLWLDSAAFYERNYLQAPNLRVSIKNYGIVLHQQGRTEDAKRIFSRLPERPREKKVD